MFGHHFKKVNMNTKLNHNIDWAMLAQKAEWSASKLAQLLGISVRTLERHFVKSLGRKPKAWLVEQRQRHAAFILSNGCSVKETAASLRYKRPSQLTAQYKKYWGYAPTKKVKNGDSEGTSPFRGI